MTFPVQTSEFLDLYRKKEAHLLSLFSKDGNSTAIYEKIIELGKSLPKPSPEIIKESNLVAGCQSLVYMCSEMDKDGNVRYQIESDALISSGLAALLLLMYQGEKAEFIFLYPPLFIKEIGLAVVLSPGRSNGLAGMYVKMKQDAINLFLENKKSS